jgi:hypothetical protein
MHLCNAHTHTLSHTHTHTHTHTNKHTHTYTRGEGKHALCRKQNSLADLFAHIYSRALRRNYSHAHSIQALSYVHKLLDVIEIEGVYA